MNLFIPMSQMKFYILGPCHCKDKHGKADKNEIFCATGTTFEQLDRCQDDESCSGPKSLDEAVFFSKSEFCSKGTLKYFTVNQIDFSHNEISFTKAMHLNILHFSDLDL